MTILSAVWSYAHNADPVRKVPVLSSFLPLFHRQVSLSLFVGEDWIKRIGAKPHSIRITETDYCIVGFLSGFGSSCVPLSFSCLEKLKTDLHSLTKAGKEKQLSVFNRLKQNSYDRRNQTGRQSRIEKRGRGFYPDVLQQPLRKELFRHTVPGLYQEHSPRRNGFQTRTNRVLQGRNIAKDGRNPEVLNCKPP